MERCLWSAKNLPPAVEVRSCYVRGGVGSFVGLPSLPVCVTSTAVFVTGSDRTVYTKDREKADATIVVFVLVVMFVLHAARFRQLPAPAASLSGP